MVSGSRMDDQGRLVRKGVHYGGTGIGHQHHVGFVDPLPSGDTRAIEHLAILEESSVHGAGGHGDVLFFTLGIRKTQVDKLDLVVLD